MQRLQKKSFVPYLVVIQLSCLTLYSKAQTTNHLLNPSFFDQFSSAQIVSDSLIRIFGLSYQREEFIGWSAFMGDYKLNGDQFTVTNQFIASNECSFNYGITALPVLPLLDGGVILGFNPFDCDYWPQGGLVKLNQEGSPEWIIDFYDLDLYFTVDQMKFVDSNVIAIVMGDEEKLFINLSGEIVEYTADIPGYNTTLETPFGFLASFENRLDVLNSGFQLIDSFFIEGNATIQYIGNQDFLIKTAAKYYSYSPEEGLLTWPLSRSTFGCVWTSPKHYWGYSNLLHSVIQFDTLFEPLDTFSVARGFQPLMGIANDSIIFIAGQHSNGLNKGIGTIQFSESNPHFHFPGDIGVTQIEVADTILVDFVSGVFWGGGWYLHYDYINVEVTNFGNETVEAYWIENKATSECGFCYYQNPMWWIDTLPIAPGEKVWITLDSFIHECTGETPVSVCMTTYAPDHLPDDNVDNDSACATYSYIVGSSQVTKPVKVSVLPNPANDIIFIHLDPDEVLLPTATIFNVLGQKMERVSVTASYTSIDVSDWPAGNYFLALLDQNGKRALRQFFVAH